MAPRLNNLADLLVSELKDLYSAETQLVKTLPRFARIASHEELQSGLTEHVQQTKDHVARIERVMEILGHSPQGRTCKAMQGLIAETDDTLSENAGPAVKDAALIAAAQKIEHYEIAGYGSARTFAELLGQEEVAEILQQTLDEEGEADRLLTDIAVRINDEAGADLPGPEDD